MSGMKVSEDTGITESMCLAQLESHWQPLWGIWPQTGETNKTGSWHIISRAVHPVAQCSSNVFWALWWRVCFAAISAGEVHEVDQLQQDVVGEGFTDIKMKSKVEVKILTVVTSSIVVHEQEATVSPLQLLGRSICLLDGSLDLPTSVMFVLTPRHSPLFVLCTAKAALWSLLASLVYTPSQLPDDPQYIGDGVHLL